MFDCCQIWLSLHNRSRGVRATCLPKSDTNYALYFQLNDKIFITRVSSWTIGVWHHKEQLSCDEVFSLGTLTFNDIFSFSYCQKTSLICYVWGLKTSRLYNNIIHEALRGWKCFWFEFQCQYRLYQFVPPHIDWSLKTSRLYNNKCYSVKIDWEVPEARHDT